MRLQLTVPEKLERLNAAQPRSPWRSISERRRCIACEQLFRGENVVMRQTRAQPVQLACPKCGAGPALWVRPGDPLLDDEVWNDWQSALAFAAAQSEDDLEPAG